MVVDGNCGGSCNHAGCNDKCQVGEVTSTVEAANGNGGSYNSDHNGSDGDGVMVSSGCHIDNTVSGNAACNG